jgi:hypothetical protein
VVAAGARPLTIAGAGREASVVARRERWKTVCARGASLAPLVGRSASPLGARMCQSCKLALVVLAALGIAVAWPASADELTQRQAIAVATAASAGHCSTATPCTFDARREGARWYVTVVFTKRNSPGDTPLPYPGGHETIVVDDTGKVVDTMVGE